MNKVITFGKVAHYSHRAINLVEVELNLRNQSDGRQTFSVCGGFWNHIHTDYVECGQCLDEIAKYKGNDPLFKRIYRLWKEYHLKYTDEIPEQDMNEIKSLMA